MNYEDATIVRLAGDDTRPAVFDDTALEQMASAAYDTDRLQVQGPYAAVFDSFELGVAVARIGTVDGSWNHVGGMDRYDARFQVHGMGAGASIRVDALWHGRIVARAVPASSRIVDVDIRGPDIAGIDPEIVNDLGALPDDPALLETERRNRLIQRLRDTFDQPDAATGELVDRWLERNGIASVSDLITEARGVIQGQTVQVMFSPPDPAPPSPVALPVTAALLVRDQNLSVAGLLADSKVVRDQLVTQGEGPAPDLALPRRQQVIVVWVIPATVFDDDDWPGGNAGMTPAQRRAARRLAAGQWLAREGIGLAATA